MLIITFTGTEKSVGVPSDKKFFGVFGIWEKGKHKKKKQSGFKLGVAKDRTITF